MRLSSLAAREYRRETIVRLHQSGKNQMEIAHLVSVDQSVVSRVLKLFKSGASIREKVNKGAPSKLSAPQLSELSTLIQQGAEHSGFSGDHLSAPRLVRLISDRFGIAYSPSGALKLVKGLGFSKQRYQHRDVRQPDVEKWHKERFPSIKKSI